MRQTRYPKKILQDRGIDNVAALLHRQKTQIGLVERDTAHAHAGAYLILDYGAEVCGSVRILTYLAQNTHIRIRLGESVAECCAEIGGDKNATNDHALRDFETHLQSYSDMSFNQSGFRFVRIDFYGEAQIKAVLAENVIYRAGARYTYRASDDTPEGRRIERIFHTAKRTLDLCASSGYLWDGIKRDRLVWIGDMHPETLALTTLYGRMSTIERSLDFVKEQTPLPDWMNGIPMYSMWWIIILSDYARDTDAYDYLAKQLDYLEGLIDQMAACVDETGALHYPFDFVDWPTHGQPDEPAGVRAINILAARHAIKILSRFGHDTSAAQEHLDRLLLVPIEVQKSKQVTALKYLATGELNKQDRARLVKDGARGMSTFMSYYILKAVASFDRAAAISMMKQYYGAMLDLGATCFWEDFDLDWAENAAPIDRLPRHGERDIHGDCGAFCYQGYRHSLCHGWSAGVIRFIREEIDPL